MSRTSEWITRVPQAIDEVRNLSLPVIDRATLETVFKVRRRVAIRLMSRFGGFQAGKTFFIDRLQLIDRLEEISHGDHFAAARARRVQIADELELTRRLAAGGKVRIDTAADVQDRLL